MKPGKKPHLVSHRLATPVLHEHFVGNNLATIQFGRKIIKFTEAKSVKKLLS